MDYLKYCKGTLESLKNGTLYVLDAMYHHPENTNRSFMYGAGLMATGLIFTSAPVEYGMKPLLSFIPIQVAIKKIVETTDK